MTSNETSWKEVNSSLVAFDQILNVTVDNTVPWMNLTLNDTVDSPGPLSKMSTVNNSVFIKIVLLLILTAIVLLSTYKFVVRLFSGYSEKRDESSEYYIDFQDES
ncbi:hypothetical protein ACOMHN_036119 [Nucella lapillus]